jgi:NADH:ubiquinone oxidoreductase subunit K
VGLNRHRCYRVNVVVVGVSSVVLGMGVVGVTRRRMVVMMMMPTIMTTTTTMSGG